MREKYVDERYPRWLTFNMPQVTSSQADWVVRTPTVEDAQLLTAEHHVVHDALVRCALAFAEAAPEAFSDFWYGSELKRQAGIEANSAASLD
jgi:hypothetical protein